MKSFNIMSKYLVILTLLVFSRDIFAQVKIGNNPKVMLPGALLELEHESKALVITRVTTAQMNAIQANEGMLVYNTTDSCIYQRTSTTWKSLCSGANITSQNLTNGRGIIVMDGTGAVLKATSLRIDSSEIAKMMGERPIIDTLAKLIGRAPIKESVVQIIKDSISTIIQNGNVTGKDAVGSEIIKINGGTGAVLKSMNITVDTAKMMTLISNNFNKSPLKDSLGSTINNIINNNSVSGKNMTSGSLVTLSGTPTGSLLKDVNIDINTSKMKDSIASWINDKPISDSITKFVSTDATIVKSLKDSVIKEINNGTVTGKNATEGSLIKVTGGTGAVLKDMKVEADTVAMKTFIANNLNSSPIKDSLGTTINNIINNNSVSGKNMTSGSLVTLSGTPTGSLLKDVNIDINTSKMKDSIASWINDKPISDSITKFVSTDATIVKSLKDSVIKEINNGTVTGKNATEGSLIKVTGGTGAVLKDMKIEADTAAVKTFIANNLNKSPMKDSITKLMKDSISTIISSGTVTGKNATQGSLITVTGGSGAVLKDMKIEADTAAMKTFIANNLNKSPMKDSITKLMKDSISTIITNGGVTGKNTTAGSLITVTGGSGAALKDNSIAVDTVAMKTFIANNLNSSPIKDSLGSSITNIINNNGVTGKDITNGNGIIVTGGTGAALKATSLRIDSTAIAKMINQSPVKDSVTKLMRDSISSIITNGGVTGKNATQGSLITVTGGTGAVLKDMKIEADTAAMKTFIANNLNKSPMKDSITKLMKDSISTIISSGTVTGKNATQGSLITVTGGTGAVLKDMKIEADTAAMKTFIANNLNKSPMKDSITKLMKDSISTIITNGGVTGKNATQGSLITVTGGTGAVLKDMKIEADTAAMKTFIANNLNKSPMKDSITKLMKDSISTIITNGGVTGKNTTAGSLITVTGGSGAALKDNSIAVDTVAMKTFIANNLNSSPIKDSLGSSITNIINNNGVTGKDITNGNGIIVTGGTGAALKATSLRIDSTAIAKMINQSPVKDSVTKLMRDSISSIISNGAVNGKALTGVGIKVSANGATSVLKDVTITWDSTAVYTKIKSDSVAITNMIAAAGSLDLDKDSTNEIQKLSLSGNVIKLSKNGDSVSIAAFKNMARNGTSISGDSVVLGGTLDRPTTITTSATNTLTLAGLQSGASTDSIMTDSAGVVRHRSISTLKREKVVIFTSNYTVLADDEILIYRGTGPTGTHTLTLPSAAANKDRVLQIVNMGKGDDIDLNLSTSILTIGGIADVTETFIRNTVSGAGYGAGASFGNSMKIVSDGTQWIKIGL